MSKTFSGIFAPRITKMLTVELDAPDFGRMQRHLVLLSTLSEEALEDVLVMSVLLRRIVCRAILRANKPSLPFAFQSSALLGPMR